jgi:hypothetical protein
MAGSSIIAGPLSIYVIDIVFIIDTAYVLYLFSYLDFVAEIMAGKKSKISPASSLVKLS